LRLVKVRPGESKRDGNCVPIAIAEATGMSFKHVERMLLNRGPKLKSGYSRAEWEPVVRELGFTHLLEHSGKLVDSDIFEDPDGRYLVQVRGHMFCVIGSDYRDTHKNMKRRKRVHSLWVLGKA